MSSRGRGRILGRLIALVLVVVAAISGFIGWRGLDNGQPSRCVGGVAGGALENGRRMPFWGDNYRAYSLLGWLIGRTFMQGTVRDAIAASYADLAKQHPDLRFVYAESAWPWGGGFAPHKTHQNGTSVDFLVPIRSEGGEVTTAFTWIGNLWGYGINFDRNGQSGAKKIDFAAMAAHLQALEKAARARGISIKRVIFDTQLQPKLLAAAGGARQLAFNQQQAWVRHDDHYHVEFNVPCR